MAFEEQEKNEERREEAKKKVKLRATAIDKYAAYSTVNRIAKE